MFDSRKSVLAVFDADPPPDMRKAADIAQFRLEQLEQALGPFRQYLKRVPICNSHHLRHAQDIVVLDLLMEKVAHGVYEYRSRRRPLQRRGQFFRNQAKVETL